jgi:hypothetical protein
VRAIWASFRCEAEEGTASAAGQLEIPWDTADFDAEQA